MDDLISRQVAIKKFNERQRKLIYCFGFENDMVKIMNIAKSIIIAIPPAQPEIIRCKDCKHWNKGSCECREHAVNCQDYMVGDMETEAEHFCGYAKRRTDEAN